MVTLKNTPTKTPASNENKIIFRQINTESYETQKIQDNVEESFNSLSNLLKHTYETTLATIVAPSNYVIGADPVQLIFKKILANPLQSWDAQTSAFEVPTEGIYQINFDCLFAITVGAPAYVRVSINSGQLGVLTLYVVQKIVTVFSVNMTSTIALKSGDFITFSMVTDVPCTVQIQNNSRISFTTVQ